MHPIEWKKLLVNPKCILEEAIRAINQGALGIVFVVDHDLKLLGVVTDGDVRRGLLRHVTLDQPVCAVMNDQPMMAMRNTDVAELITMMEEQSIRCMPIVDENQCMIDVAISPYLRREAKNTNWVFLMAGGFGTRLKPLTDDCPKPLLKIGGRPVLENIIQQFKLHGFQKFFMSVHYKLNMVKSYFGTGEQFGVDIKYLEEEEPLGTGGSLGLLPEMSQPLIVMNADVLTKVNFRELLQFHVDSKAAVTMCVREYGMQVPYGTVQLSGHKVTGIIEKPSYQFFINAGIYVLSSEVVNDIHGKNNFDMPTLFNRLIQEGRLIVTFPIHEYWLDMGKMEDFKRAQIDISTLVS